MIYEAAGKIGWICVFLLLSLTMLFIIRRLNRRILKGNKYTKNIEKMLSKFHPFIGYGLIVLGVIHGYIELGTVTLHTGYILWASIVIMLLISVIGRRIKSTKWIKIHRIFDIVVITALITHLFFRNII